MKYLGLIPVLLIPIFIVTCGGGQGGSVIGDYTISGFIMMNSSSFEGVNVSLTGNSSDNTETNYNGYYEFNNLDDGTYIVSPNVDGYAFSPIYISVSIAGDSQGNINFNGSFFGYKIEGEVTSDGLPLEGVEMNLSGDSITSVTTDSDGTYQFSNLFNGAYDITPFLSGYVMTPLVISVDILNSSIYGKYFSAVALSDSTLIDFEINFGDLEQLGLLNEAIETSDGGFIAVGVGTANSSTNDDLLLLKADSTGSILWTNLIGGVGTDDGLSVVETSDGGYFIAGDTYSFGPSGSNVYLVKTDSNGNAVWSTTFGTPQQDHGQSILKTSTGNYLIIGSGDGVLSEDDVYLILVSENGDEIWSTLYDMSDQQSARFAEETSDGGYIIIGTTDTIYNQDNILLIKADENGNAIWDTQFGGGSQDFPGKGDSTHETVDGDYIIIGRTTSFAVGSADIWIIKTDSNGSMLDEGFLGDILYEDACSIFETIDGGYLVFGTKDVGSGNRDIYIAKVDSELDLVWTKTIGDPSYDEECRGAKQVSNGGIIIAGRIQSTSGTNKPYLLKIDGNINNY